jgi:hypothetical protein
MANQVAKGNSGVDHSGPNNKTPAPTQAPRIRFSDDFGGKGDLNYGRNRQNLPSSVEPGATVESDLAKDLRTTVTDPALAEIISRGTARNVMTGDATGRTWPGKDSMSTRGLAQHDDGLLEDIASGERGGGAKSRPVAVHPAQAKRTVDEGSVGSGLTNNQSDPVRKPSGS